MIPIVQSVEEAQDFFLSHSSGECCCRKADGTEKNVDNYADAKAFFAS